MGLARVVRMMTTAELRLTVLIPTRFRPATTVRIRRLLQFLLLGVMVVVVVMALVIIVVVVVVVVAVVVVAAAAAAAVAVSVAGVVVVVEVVTRFRVFAAKRSSQ